MSNGISIKGRLFPVVCGLYKRRPCCIWIQWRNILLLADFLSVWNKLCSILSITSRYGGIISVGFWLSLIRSNPKLSWSSIYRNYADCFSFRDAISGEGQLFAGRFGHSSTLMAFFTLLGLYDDGQEITASNFGDMSDRHWRVSLNGPMGSNGAFILYRCDSSPTYRIKTFINERPTVLPQCSDYACDLEVILSTWGPIAEKCDVEEICKAPEDDLWRKLFEMKEGDSN